MHAECTAHSCPSDVPSLNNFSYLRCAVPRVRSWVPRKPSRSSLICREVVLSLSAEHLWCFFLLFCPFWFRRWGDHSEHDQKCTGWPSGWRHYGLHHGACPSRIRVSPPDTSEESPAHVTFGCPGWADNSWERNSRVGIKKNDQNQKNPNQKRNRKKPPQSQPTNQQIKKTQARFLGFVSVRHPTYFPFANPSESGVSSRVLVHCCPLLGAARAAAARGVCPKTLASSSCQEAEVMLFLKLERQAQLRSFPDLVTADRWHIFISAREWCFGERYSFHTLSAWAVWDTFWLVFPASGPCDGHGIPIER